MHLKVMILTDISPGIGGILMGRITLPFGALLILSPGAMGSLDPIE